MVIKSLIVVIGTLFFLSLEYVFPKEKIEFKDKLSRIFKNIFFWLVNIGITPIIILPITIYVTQFELHELFKFENIIFNFLFHIKILKSVFHYLYNWLVYHFTIK